MLDLKNDLQLRDYLLPGEEVKLRIYNKDLTLNEYWTKLLPFAVKTNGVVVFKKRKNGVLYKWDRSNSYLFHVVIE